MVQQITVLTGLRIIDEIVAAHDGSHTSLDSICKGPNVELVQSLVIDVGRARLSDVEAVISGLGDLAEVFLLIAHIVFGARLNTCTLDASDGVGEQLASEIGVRPEAFPIATACR